MKLDHLIITRFCVRIRERLESVEGPSFFGPMDPLTPYNVALRKRLMEIASLPSVAAQAGVGWVVVVDRGLPTRDRAWLEARLAKLPRADLHYLDPQDDLRELDWLEPYIDPEATHVVTSNLDDDDALPAGWAAHVRDHLTSQGRLPEVMVLGTHDVLEWDLIPRPLSPFGFVKPWHRGHFPSACGFSLMSSRAAGACVMGMRHRFSAVTMDPDQPAPNGNVAYYRARFAETFARWPKAQLFYDFGAATGPVLMTNHAVNDQAARLYEAAEARRRVRGLEDLGNAPVSLSAYLRAIPHLGRGHPRRVVTRLLDRLVAR